MEAISERHQVRLFVRRWHSADGRTDMKNLLGGKGANLAEMANMGIPVPAGFTLTTEICTYYYDHDQTYPDARSRGGRGHGQVEEIMGTKFGDPNDPLLVSVRSGARSSMPGMMETVLNCRSVLGHDPRV
jgi:pyruvate,orthophosphate dikinase